MQTFLPYPEFSKSAACLDHRRLGKQRIEVLQILEALQFGTRWSNHPATKMWRGCEGALVEYGLAICSEWINRGYIDYTRFEIKKHQKDIIGPIIGPIIRPHWLGGLIHKTHQSKLLQKDYNWYKKFGWDVPLDLAYYWPEGRSDERA